MCGVHDKNLGKHLQVSTLCEVLGLGHGKCPGGHYLSVCSEERKDRTLVFKGKGSPSYVSPKWKVKEENPLWRNKTAKRTPYERSLLLTFPKILKFSHLKNRNIFRRLFHTNKR